jgi:hypothetical protein
MSQTKDSKKSRCTRSLVLVMLAWVFIGGQGLLAAGSVYNYNAGDQQVEAGKMPWSLVAQGANRMRLVAMQARPDVIGDVAIFLAVANALGIVALACGLISWSRSQHRSGKLTMAAATVVILVNSLLNLPYA